MFAIGGGQWEWGTTGLLTGLIKKRKGQEAALIILVLARLAPDAACADKSLLNCFLTLKSRGKGREVLSRY